MWRGSGPCLPLELHTAFAFSVCTHRRWPVLLPHNSDVYLGKDVAAGADDLKSRRRVYDACSWSSIWDRGCSGQYGFAAVSIHSQWTVEPTRTASLAEAVGNKIAGALEISAELSAVLTRLESDPTLGAPGVVATSVFADALGQRKPLKARGWFPWTTTRIEDSNRGDC